MLEAYRTIARESMLSEIEALAEALHGRSLQHVNSTRTGGGVAELLTRLTQLTASMGIQTRWDVIKGSTRFFEVTKTIHNGLQGADVDLGQQDREVYMGCLRENAKTLELGSDVIFIHDPQPAYLIQLCDADPRRMVWRCHIDLSAPNQLVWRFLREAVERYATAVFHVARFARNLPIPQILVAPSIDPLADKNRDLTDAEISAVTDRFGIDRGRPIILQVSRFDRFKDPLGVIEAYRLVRENFDCQLVLAGGAATDDPEGPEMLTTVREAAGTDQDIHVLDLPPGSDIDINALQRASTVVLQKSTREGFGLTVAEAMWKAKPVIGGAVGGIPTQIIHDVTGFLVHSPEGAAFRLRYLLSHPRRAERLGEAGRDHVRRNFLITRHLRDYLLLMLLLLEPSSGRTDDAVTLALRT